MSLGRGCWWGVPRPGRCCWGVPGPWVLTGCPQADADGVCLGCAGAARASLDQVSATAVSQATSVLLGCPWAVPVALGCLWDILSGHLRAVGTTGASQDCGLGHRYDNRPHHSIREGGSTLPWTPGASQGSQRWFSAGTMLWLCPSFPALRQERRAGPGAGAGAPGHTRRPNPLSASCETRGVFRVVVGAVWGTPAPHTQLCPEPGGAV